MLSYRVLQKIERLGSHHVGRQMEFKLEAIYEVPSVCMIFHNNIDSLKILIQNFLQDCIQYYIWDTL